MGSSRMNHSQAWVAVGSVAALEDVGFANEPDGIDVLVRVSAFTP